MIISTIFVYRLFKGLDVITDAEKQSLANNSLAQLRFLWLPALVLLPLALMATSMMGYHYSALYLEQHVEMTLWFFAGLFFFKELLLRSLYIAERHLRLDDAIRRRALLQQAGAADPQQTVYYQ